jgi:hypothetical protein
MCNYNYNYNLKNRDNDAIIESNDHEFIIDTKKEHDHKTVNEQNNIRSFFYSGEFIKVSD